MGHSPLTTIFRGEEVQVPLLLLLSQDGAPEVVRKCCRQCRAERAEEAGAPPHLTHPRMPHAPLEKMRCHTAPQGKRVQSRLWRSGHPSQGLGCPPSHPPIPGHGPPSTRANFDEAVVLDEDGVTGQVPMDDGRVAGVQKAERGRRAKSSSGCGKQVQGGEDVM